MPASRDLLLKQLKKLNSTQFDELLFSFSDAEPYIPEHANRTDKAIALIRFLEGRNELALLEQILEERQRSRSNLLWVPGFFRHFFGQTRPSTNPRDTGRDKSSETIHPHLVDRQKQVDVLEDALPLYLNMPRKGRKHPPLLCILHGADEEYGGFIERMEHEFLPAHLPAAGSRIKNVLLPLQGENNRAERLRRCLQNDLSKHFNPYRDDHALLVEANLYDYDWFGSGDDNLLRCFIDFWHDNLENLSGPHPCIVFLCFRFTGRGSGIEHLTKHFAQLTALDTLDAFALHFPHIELPGLVLPRLESIPYQDARNWLDLALVRKHPCFERGRMRQSIDALYPDNTKTYPMETLSEKLAELLRQSCLRKP